MSTIPDAWQGILDPGEKIVWQGKPEPGVQVEWASPFLPLLFIFFTGFSVFWMVLASRDGGVFWMFGLIFFIVGIYNLVGVHFYNAYLRANTHYTLTDRRALIASQVFGKRSLESYPITQSTQLNLEERGAFGSINFASKSVRHQNGSTEEAVGFQRLTNARDVYSLMRSVQGTAA